ncbi:MAG: NHLP family bacteriocin export ABC transporter peptidase/permease/ATPase subunit [Betaproteobacteria bacterium]|nr:MAG: NHLP family bacteriocin export ABC transporter peptidase/permease/ATPase subunit [Betaproteobacteria bacterium]
MPEQTQKPNQIANSKRHKTPTIMQMEAVECGAASLAMILGYHGRWVPLEELRVKCGVSRDGSKASNVLKAARSYGLTSKGFNKEPENLRTMSLPMIVFWNFNHFLVVEGFGNGKVFLNDPAAGPRVVSDEEFDLSFTGVVLTFEAGAEFKKGGQPQSVLAALKRRFVGLNEAIAYVVLVGVALVLPGLVVPVFTSVFIDKLLISGMESWLKPLLLGIVITALLRVALTWLESYYLLRVRTQIALASASKFFWHVLRLPVEFYTQRSPGEISSRVRINDKVAGMLSGDLAHAFLAVIQAVFFAALMLFYDVWLTLISIVVVSINVFVMQQVAQKTKEASQKLAIDGGKVYGATMSGLQVMETVKSSGGESSFFSKWAGYEAKYVNSEQAMARVGLIMGSVPALLTVLNSLLILGVGGMRVIDGHLSIGMLVAFQSLAASFTGPVQRLVGLGKKMLEVQGDMNRLDDVMQYREDPWLNRGPLPQAQGGRVAAKLAGKVELNNISFGYNPAGSALVENFNLVLNPGERVAIVGPSGCGKSTISRLVMGLYEPWGGSIKFDDQPREAFGRYEFFNSVALVDQDIVLFEGSIRDNLSMWDKSVSDQDIMQAAKDACIHDVIMSRPGGYDSKLAEDGVNMSGGQRQRLEIARALATNPRILVMDEGTSALDPATEQQIDENLRRRGCACIIIAHRLSTIRDADEIVVLSYGHIVERGTHDSLMQIDGGFYSRLIAQH